MQNVFHTHLKNLNYFSMFIKFIDTIVAFMLAQLLAKSVNYANSGDVSLVLQSSLVLLLLLFIVKIAQIVLTLKYETLKSAAVHRCKQSLYQILLSNPLHILYAQEHGSSMEKLNNDFDITVERILTLYPNLWINTLSVATYFLFLARQNLFLATILLIISFLQIIPPVIVKKFMQVNYDNCRKIEAQITDFTISSYRGFAAIKLYHLKDWWLKKLAVYHKEYAKIGNTSIYTATAENVLNDFISMILKYGTYLLVGLFILLKQTDITLGIQAIALSGSLFSGIISIFAVIPRLAVAKKAEIRLSTWINEKKSAPYTDGNNEIQFSDVTKSMDGKPVLQNMSISFDTNHIHIIKGPNGSGKTTLFRLITGLLDCENGTLHVNQIKPADFPDKVFPQKLFYLPQEDVMFHFTPYALFESVDPQLPAKALPVAKSFRLTEKQIYETNIADLSGGERKKVYLSLAFAVNPVLLLLDEPTNFLDTESKTFLLSLLKQRSGGTMIITHDSLFDEIGNYFYTLSKGVLIHEKTNL